MPEVIEIIPDYNDKDMLIKLMEQLVKVFNTNEENPTIGLALWIFPLDGSPGARYVSNVREESVQDVMRHWLGQVTEEQIAEYNAADNSQNTEHAGEFHD